MITIDRQKCNGCSECLDACYVGAIYLVDNKAYIEQSHCTACESCIEICPAQAIQSVASIVAQKKQTVEVQPGRTSVLPTIKAAIVTLGSSLLPVLISKIGEVLTAKLENKPDRSALTKRKLPASGRQYRRRFRGGA
jgi:NAD-dependent dihydropyrimidine dehydrogenase PreA subunit